MAASGRIKIAFSPLRVTTTQPSSFSSSMHAVRDEFSMIIWHWRSLKQMICPIPWARICSSCFCPLLPGPEAAGGQLEWVWNVAVLRASATVKARSNWPLSPPLHADAILAGRPASSGYEGTTESRGATTYEDPNSRAPYTRPAIIVANSSINSNL